MPVLLAGDPSDRVTGTGRKAIGSEGSVAFFCLPFGESEAGNRPPGSSGEFASSTVTLSLREEREAFAALLSMWSAGLLGG